MSGELQTTVLGQNFGALTCAICHPEQPPHVRALGVLCVCKLCWLQLFTEILNRKLAPGHDSVVNGMFRTEVMPPSQDNLVICTLNEHVPHECGVLCKCR